MMSSSPNRASPPSSSFALAFLSCSTSASVSVVLLAHAAGRCSGVMLSFDQVPSRFGWPYAFFPTT